MTVPTLKESVLNWEPKGPAARSSRPADKNSIEELTSALRKLDAPTRREVILVLESLRLEVSEDIWGPSPALASIVRPAA